MLILVIAILLIASAISFVKFGTAGGESQSISLFGADGSLPHVWLPYALLALVVFLIALWILNKILNLPKAVKRSTATRDAAKSRQALDDGLLDIASGDFEKGERTLVSHLDGGAGDAPKYLAAAKSAESRGASDQADLFLKKASAASNEASIAVRTAQAEMMIGRGQFDKAETLLTNLHHAMPKNKHIMSLLAGALQKTGNHEKLSSLTQIMRKTGAADAQTIAAIESPTWSNIIDNADAADLGKTWEALPSEAKANPDAAGAYVGRLMDIGEHDKAETIVQKLVNTNYNEKLAGVYGDINTTNVAKQLENAERWAKTNGQSASLASTIGKLSARREMWGKARDSLVKSAQLDLTPDVCAELGDVLESMGESAKAKECYRNAALLGAGKSPVGLLSDLPGLASKLADVVGNKAAAVAKKAS